jgi:cell division protein FtsB
MRWPVIILTILVLALQYPLWLGKGGWLRVWDVDAQLQGQRDINRGLEQRNAGLEAEVTDLKSGNEAIEERARFDLGLTKPDEIFVHVPSKN